MSKPSGKRAYWCDNCHVPLLGDQCLACGRKGRELCTAGLVPVFRPEISYLNKRTGNRLQTLLKEGELWVTPCNHIYYCQGAPVLKLSAANQQSSITEQAGALTPLRRSKKTCRTTLRQANRTYIEKLQYEAENFIRKTAASYAGKTMLVSFSGGKDSTVVSHLVMNALGRSDILHIFADTTIEFPDTYSYIQDFQQRHPLTPFVQAQSNLDFFATARSIGPPSRILRWCCTTHKTNPLSKLINSMSPDYGVLTFDGIRRAESTRRSKYSRLSDKHKIAGETLASPILQWTELAVWIYMVFHNIFFNPAYKKGFRRVGCLYCPFNSDWSHDMIMFRYPRKGKNWQTFLLEQAVRMKHPQPEIFATKGWRARAGGRGLDYYKSSLESTPCILSEHAVMYQILSGDVTLIRSFLRPLGPQSRVARDEFSETFLILDYKSKEPLASVEVSYNDEAVRINYLIKKYRRFFQQRIEGQLKKLQSCIFCGACGSKCKINALETDSSFVIDDKKCVSCLACVQHKCPIVDSLTKKGK